VVNHKKFWLAGATSAVAVGLAGGVFGAFLSLAPSVFNQSTTPVVSMPIAIEPGTSILLFNRVAARGSAKVDGNELILLNLTTKTGQNQIAPGVLGGSKLEVCVFDSADMARTRLEVPTKTSGQVQMLLLDQHDAISSANTPAQS
jgi:hypothetical protein